MDHGASRHPRHSARRSIRGWTEVGADSGAASRVRNHSPHGVVVYSGLMADRRQHVVATEDQPVAVEGWLQGPHDLREAGRVRTGATAGLQLVNGLHLPVYGVLMGRSGCHEPQQPQCGSSISAITRCPGRSSAPWQATRGLDELDEIVSRLFAPNSSAASVSVAVTWFSGPGSRWSRRCSRG